MKKIRLNLILSTAVLIFCMTQADARETFTMVKRTPFHAGPRIAIGTFEGLAGGLDLFVSDGLSLTGTIGTSGIFNHYALSGSYYFKPKENFSIYVSARTAYLNLSDAGAAAIALGWGTLMEELKKAHVLAFGVAPGIEYQTNIGFAVRAEAGLGFATGGGVVKFYPPISISISWIF
ncbi:MAG: hypothetical protein HYS98_06365 [Deltaproteobacteria bacterium]|nr:hypothetical protein [Deltaproteobacteria bacterium]